MTETVGKVNRRKFKAKKSVYGFYKLIDHNIIQNDESKKFSRSLGALVPAGTRAFSFSSLLFSVQKIGNLKITNSKF